MKGLGAFVTTLIAALVLHAFVTFAWPKAVPWRTTVMDAPPAWHATAGWFVVLLLAVAAIALIVVFIASIDDAPGGSVLLALVSTVLLPYAAAVGLCSVTSARSTGDSPTATTPAETVGHARDGPSERETELKVTTAAEAEAGLSKVRDRLRTSLSPALLRLNTDIEDVKSRLRACGVTRSADLKANPRARILAQELAEAIRFRDAVSSTIESHRSAEFELDSLLRRLRRFQLVADAGVPEGELVRMNATLRLLDGQIADRAGQPKELSSTELDELVDRELGRKPGTAESSPQPPG